MSVSEKVNEVIELLKPINSAVVNYETTRADDYLGLFKVTIAERNIGFKEEVSAVLAKLISLQKTTKEENDAYKKKVFNYVKTLTSDIDLFSKATGVSEESKKTCAEILKKFSDIEKDIPAHLKVEAPRVERKS